MVASGRRSDGCANCRRAKKGCDQKRPTCTRCSRLQQACYGYKDEIESHSWNRHHTVTASIPPSMMHLGSPDDPDQKLLLLFHEHFCTGEYEILEQFTHNKIVHDLMLACSLIISTKKEEIKIASTRVTMLYVQALREVLAALADPQRVKEDVTLVSAIVICIFERINPLGSSLSSNMTVHFQGLTHLVCARGLAQIQTLQGRAIFRLARRMMLENAIRTQTAAPLFVISCTQGLNSDPVYNTVDKLAILTTRLSILRENVNNGSVPDDEPIAASKSLRNDFETFGCQEIPDAIQARSQVPGMNDHDNSYVFDLLDIISHSLDFRTLLLEWQVYLGIATELEDEMLSLSIQAEPNRSKDRRYANLGFRQRLASTIYSRATCLLDSVTQMKLPKGWIIIVFRLVGPLYFAGSWLQRELCIQDRGSSKDTAAPIHGLGCSPTQKISVQLESIVGTLAHIANRLCDRYAKETIDQLTMAGP